MGEERIKSNLTFLLQIISTNLSENNNNNEKLFDKLLRMQTCSIRDYGPVLKSFPSSKFVIPYGEIHSPPPALENEMLGVSKLAHL